MMSAGKEKGFTLVEVMVALAVTALMLTAVYQTVSSASSAREKLSIENARHHAARIMIERIGRELQSLHYLDNDERTRFSGGLGGGDLELLSFTTTASTPLAKEPGLPARVSYRLEIDSDAESTSYILSRTERGSLAIDAGRAYKLAEEITDMEIRFLNNGNWINRWDSQSAQGVPAAVALTVSIGTNKDEDVFRTIWPIGD